MGLRTSKPSIAILIAALVAVAFGLLSSPWNRAGGTQTAEALSFLQQIPPSPAVAPGDVVHQKYELYLRFGAIAEDVIDHYGIDTEVRTVESWEEIGDNGDVIRSYAITRDGSQEFVQEDIQEPGSPGIFTSSDPRSGEILIELPYRSIPRKDSNSQVELYENALLSGNARVLAQTFEEITLEVTAPISQEEFAVIAKHGPGLQVPYMWDLNPIAVLDRITLSSEGIVTTAERFAVRSDGTKILIASREMVEFDILDEFPSTTLSN